jgi:hydrogenase maturation protease
MGTEWRRDDGVGLAVARRVSELKQLGSSVDCRVVAPLADPLDLLGYWEGAALAVVVDATRSDLVPGTISRIELGGSEPQEGAGSDSHSGPALGRSSTHGIGLVGALRLARVVNQAPARTVVVGVEGEDFGQGSGLSPSVAASVDKAAVCVLELVEEASKCA